MKTGDEVLWGEKEFTIITEYDEDFVYIAIGDDGAQLVHKTELSVIGTFPNYRNKAKVE